MVLRLIRIAAAATLVMLGGAGTVNGGTDDLAMVTPSPLEREEAEGSRLPLRVSIANVGTTSTVVRLLLVSSTEPAGAHPLGLQDAVPVDGTLATTGSRLPVGEVWNAELPLDPTAPPGRYRARLAAVSTSGGLATLDVSLTLRSVIPEGGLAAELPESLTFNVDRSLLAWFDGGHLTNGALLPSKTGHGLVSVAAPFVNSEAALLGLEAGQGKLAIVTAPTAGRYVGVLRVIDSPAEMTVVTINVRDAIVWPIIGLLLGVLAAVGADSGFTRVIPRLVLRARLQALIERSERAVAIEPRSDVEWPGSGAEPVLLFNAGPPASGLLVRERDAALYDFNVLDDAEQREKRWGLHGSEFEKIAALVERQESLRWDATSVRDSWSNARNALGAHADALAASALAERVSRSFAGGLIEGRAEFERLASDRQNLASEMGEFAATAKALAMLGRRARGRPPFANEVEALQRRLATLPTGSAAETTQVLTDVRALHSRITNSDAAEPEFTPEGRDEELESFLAGEGFGDTGGYGELQPLEPTSAELASAATRANLIFVFGATAFALLTGLTVQYFPNATFGSSGDYAGALVWGFTAAGAAQLARRALRTFAPAAAPSYEDV